jgi:tetratricopeptide (TPR) repeat protein
VSLTESEQASVERVPTENLEAWDYFLRGQAYFNHGTKESSRQARERFERAIKLDSEFAWGHAFLAVTYWSDWWNQWTDDPRVLERAFEFARRAIVLDDSSSFPYTVLSWLDSTVNRNHQQAITEAQKAVSLSPNHPAPYAALANALTHSGYQQETIRAAKTAIRLDPHGSSPAELYLCNAYRLLGRHEDAIAACKRHLNAHPSALTTHLVLAVIYTDLERTEAAKKAADEILRISPRFSLEILRQRLAYKDPAVTDHMIAALRKAGLPE